MTTHITGCILTPDGWIRGTLGFGERITAIEGETLALCAEQYFAQSEQTPTRVRLAVGQADVGEGMRWRAGGMLIQNIAEDDARGSTAEAWVAITFLPR